MVSQKKKLPRTNQVATIIKAKKGKQIEWGCFKTATPIVIAILLNERIFKLYYGLQSVIDINSQTEVRDTKYLQT